MYTIEVIHSVVERSYARRSIIQSDVNRKEIFNTNHIKKQVSDDDDDVNTCIIK